MTRQHQTDQPRGLDLEALGLSPEEARKLGALENSEAEVEALFDPKYRTEASPPHRLIWDRDTDLSLWVPPQRDDSPFASMMEASLAAVKAHVDAGTIYDASGKVTAEANAAVGANGYWGMLVPGEYGGVEMPFRNMQGFLTRMATVDGTVAGMASVHQCIGCVNPIVNFGNDYHKQKWLPRLASGELQSGFALTEPGAGSDLTAVKTRAVPDGDDLVIYGEKLFITNVGYGRLAALVVRLDDPEIPEDRNHRVVIVELPEAPSDEFHVKEYGIHALKHAYNYGLVFNGLRVPKKNMLDGWGLMIAYYGLNFGRVVVCAGGAGAMRKMLANMPQWCYKRHTYGGPIGDRENVTYRAGWIGAHIVGAEALADWCSWLLDEGYRGELECLIAKIFGSEAAWASAMHFMKTHGGRSFLEGHLFGDNVHDFLAPLIYEGEGDMLAMGFFKALVKAHGMRYMEPIGKRQKNLGIKFNPANPIHLARMFPALAPYGTWRVGQMFKRTSMPNLAWMPKKLRRHAKFALKGLAASGLKLSKLMVQYQEKLADRQIAMKAISFEIQTHIIMLVTALAAAKSKDEVVRNAADVLCQLKRMELTGEKETPQFQKQITQLGARLLDPTRPNPFNDGISEAPILMDYEDDDSN